MGEPAGVVPACGHGGAHPGELAGDYLQVADHEAGDSCDYRRYPQPSKPLDHVGDLCGCSKQDARRGSEYRFGEYVPHRPDPLTGKADAEEVEVLSRSDEGQEQGKDGKGGYGNETGEDESGRDPGESDQRRFHGSICSESPDCLAWSDCNDGHEEKDAEDLGFWRKPVNRGVLVDVQRVGMSGTHV